MEATQHRQSPTHRQRNGARRIAVRIVKFLDAIPRSLLPAACARMCCRFRHLRSGWRRFASTDIIYNKWIYAYVRSRHTIYPQRDILFSLPRAHHTKDALSNPCIPISSYHIHIELLLSVHSTNLHTFQCMHNAYRDFPLEGDHIVCHTSGHVIDNQ